MTGSPPCHVRSPDRSRNSTTGPGQRCYGFRRATDLCGSRKWWHGAPGTAVDDRGGLAGVQELERLSGLVDTYDRWSEELAATGIPSTLQYDDLHDANVFRRADGSVVFLDWGDSVVGHPFGSLYFALRVAKAKFELLQGAPEMAKLTDAYLEPFVPSYGAGLTAICPAVAGA